jgi:hypothetical protein
MVNSILFATVVYSSIKCIPLLFTPAVPLALLQGIISWPEAANPTPKDRCCDIGQDFHVYLYIEKYILGWETGA